MKVYISNCDEHSQEFYYDILKNQKEVENAFIFCLGTNLVNRYYNLTDKLNKNDSYISNPHRIVELNDKVANYLLAYDNWTKLEKNKNIQGWEYLFPYKLQAMICQSKDAGIDSISNPNSFSRKLLTQVRLSNKIKIKNRKMIEEIMKQVEEKLIK